MTTQESKDLKEWISFVAEIIRNKIFTNLIDAQEKLGNKTNLLTVPAALAELDKYEICEKLQGGYCVYHPLSRTQKQIFKALNISIDEVKEETGKICEMLNARND